MIELGGNIKLENFENLEPGLLVVVKKFVGNYTKKISEEIAEPKELSLHLKEAGKNKYKLEAKLIVKDKEFKASASDANLFFALDKVLSKLKEEAKK